MAGERVSVAKAVTLLGLFDARLGLGQWTRLWGEQ
jgi:hypothetical protein